MPSRMMAGIRIQWAIGRLVSELSGAQWGVAEAYQGEFVVPDHFGRVLVSPVSPRICLVAGVGDHVVLREGVRLINRLVIGESSAYLVAQDFSKCPV